MGRLEGIWPKHIKSCLKAAHRSNDPKKITQAIVGFVW